MISVVVTENVLRQPTTNNMMPVFTKNEIVCFVNINYMLLQKHPCFFRRAGKAPASCVVFFPRLNVLPRKAWLNGNQSFLGLPIGGFCW